MESNCANANFVFIHVKAVLLPSLFCLAFPFSNICLNYTDNFYSYAILYIFLMIT